MKLKKGSWLFSFRSQELFFLALSFLMCYYVVTIQQGSDEVNEELYSVGQISKALGVSRQAVYQKIRSDKRLQADLQPFTVKQGKYTLYSLQGQKRIIQAFSEHSSAKSKPDIDINCKPEADKEQLTNANKLIDSLQNTIDILRADIETLKEQLTVKDAQISREQEHVKELTTALHAAQALHGLEHKEKALEVEAVPVDHPGEHPQPEQKPERQRRTTPERVAAGLPKLSLFQKIKKALK